MLPEWVNFQRIELLSSIQKKSGAYQSSKGVTACRGIRLDLARNIEYLLRQPLQGRSCAPCI